MIRYFSNISFRRSSVDLTFNVKNNEASYHLYLLNMETSKIVKIPSGYDLVYLDRSYVAPVNANTSFSAKKTNLVLVGAYNAYENTGCAQV